MDESAWLAQRFEENRVHLRAVAYPDARVGGRGGRCRPGVVAAAQPRRTSGVHNLRAWLTTVVAQQCFWTCFAPAPLHR